MHAPRDLFAPPLTGAYPTMVISNSRQFIFFHIPKCAGTSLTQMLAAGARWNDIVLGGTATGEAVQDHYQSHFGLRKHSRPTEVRTAIGSETYLRYYKFAFVRDPVCRFISAAQFVKHHVDTGSPWMLSALGPRRAKQIRAMQSVREMMSSHFIQHLFDRLGNSADAHCDDIELCFAPQVLYLDAAERDAGRFSYFRVDEMDYAWPVLQARGVLDEGTPLDTTRYNASAPVLTVDIDADALAQLQSLYRSDYTAFM